MTKTSENWLTALHRGEEKAVEILWQEYFTKIVRLAKRRMGGLRLCAADEEDIAVSAMNSFCRMAKNRDNPLNDSTELWKLLATIVRRKINKERQRQYAGKRQEYALAGESVFGGTESPDGNLSPGIQQVADTESSPYLAIELAETLEKIMSLPHADPIVQYRLDGMSNTEIAKQLGCSTRTVQRSIEKIQTEWNAWLAKVKNDWEQMVPNSNKINF
ncbi:MAG: LuxR C-terminal-related transcriptional regulator [Planctomycetaceae bacterium]|nr:LuxR C-terminal-related transcriptional regulator [Planctomycetaceae bacterium]